MSDNINELTSLQRKVIDDVMSAIGNNFSFDGYSNTQSKNQFDEYCYRFTYKPDAISLELHVNPSKIKLSALKEGGEHFLISNINKVGEIAAAIMQKVDQYLEVLKLESAEMLTDDFVEQVEPSSRRIRAI